MVNILIGNTFRVSWRILTNNEATPLTGRNIRLILAAPSGKPMPITPNVSSSDSSSLTFVFQGADQKETGIYRLIVIENKGVESQALTSETMAFRLVSSPGSADSDIPSFGDAIIVDCGTGNLKIGYQGDSAFESWLRAIRPESGKDTEADFMEWLRKPSDEAAAVALKQAKYAQEQGDAAKRIGQEISLLGQTLTKNENARIAAEKTREENESARKVAETKRQNVESARASAEQTRQASEESRVSSETTRTKAERGRQENEYSRKEAENARIEAEASRKTSENARKVAETNRSTAEAGRTETEKTRVASESSRNNSEQQRKTAEESRVKAENSRISEFSELKKASEEATQTANTAATNANQAAEEARKAAFGYNEPLAQVINVNTSGDSATYVHQFSYETKTFRVKKGLAYMFYLQAAADLYLRLTYSESLPSDGIGYDFIKELVPSSDYCVEYYTPNQDGYYSITYYKGDMNVICYSFDPIIIGAEQQIISYITNELSTFNTYPSEYKQGSIYQGVPDDSIKNCIYNPNYFYNSGKPIIIRNAKAADGKYWKVRIALYDKNKKWVRDAQNYQFKDGDTKLKFAEPYFQYAISLYSADGEGLNCAPEDYSTNLIQFIGNGLRLGQLENDIKNLRDERQETYPIKLTKLLDFTIEKAIDVTSGYGDAVCFDGNVFQFVCGNEFCYIHDAESGRLVQTLAMPNPNTNYHNNCVTLGGKYNDSDEFPLIYAAQEGPRKCIVYRVSKTEGQYSLSVVQEILFSTPLGTYLVYRNCLIDAYEGKLVMCGLKNTPWSGTDKNTLQYIVFNLPNPTTPQVQLTESDIIFRSKVYENFPTPQGGEMRFGMLYQVFGVDSPQKLMVWEMGRDRFVKEINLTEELANREPEGLYIYKDEIHIVYKGGAVYGITKAKLADLQAAINEVNSTSVTNRADLDRTMSRVASPDDRALPLLCGQPPILFGAGTPKEAIVPNNWNQYDPATGEGYNWNGKPSAIGQQYIDTTAASGGRYIAARDGEWDLKWINS